MRQIEHTESDALSLERALSALGDVVRLSVVRVLADGQEHIQADFEVPVEAIADRLARFSETAAVRVAGAGLHPAAHRRDEAGALDRRI
jgi:hypothetical protein